MGESGYYNDMGFAIKSGNGPAPKGRKMLIPKAFSLYNTHFTMTTLQSMKKLADGLSEIHGRGHRLGDIKSDNVMRRGSHLVFIDLV